MADIVERLRAFEAWIRNPGEQKTFNINTDVFDDAADEIERLRAALELFACDCKGEELCFNTDNCRNFIARAALEDKQ